MEPATTSSVVITAVGEVRDSEGRLLGPDGQPIQEEA